MAFPEKASDKNSEKEGSFKSLKTDGRKQIVIHDKHLHSPHQQESNRLPLPSTSFKAEHPQESTESEIFRDDEFNISDRKNKPLSKHVTPLHGDAISTDKWKVQDVENLTIQKVPRLSNGSNNNKVVWRQIWVPFSEIDSPDPNSSSPLVDAESSTRNNTPTGIGSPFPESFAEHPQESTESEIFHDDEFNISDRTNKPLSKHVTPLPGDAICTDKRKVQDVENCTIPQKVRRLSNGSNNYKVVWRQIWVPFSEIDLPDPNLSSPLVDAESSTRNNTPTGIGSPFPESTYGRSHCETVTSNEGPSMYQQPNGEIALQTQQNQTKLQEPVPTGATRRPKTEEKLQVTKTGPQMPLDPGSSTGPEENYIYMPNLMSLGAITLEGRINFDKSQLVKYDLKKKVLKKRVKGGKRGKKR